MLDFRSPATLGYTRRHPYGPGDFERPLTRGGSERTFEEGRCLVPDGGK
jgi:hypothetical protein